MKPKLLLLFLGALGASGCGADFDPYNRLTTFRVLALVADPPTPGSGETANVSALVYTPELGATESPAGLSYQWSWCPFPGSPNDGYPCQVTQAQLAMLGTAGMALPPLDLGSAPTVTFPNAVNPAVLAQLCAGVPGAPQVLDCTGGFPVQVKVKVTTATDEITSVTTLRLRFDPGTAANKRPVIDGLVAEIANPDPAVTTPTIVPVDAAVPRPAQFAASLPRGKETVIKAQLQPTVIESYAGLDDNMNPAMVDERLTLAWFIESGDTKFSHTSTVEGVAGLERALSNKWKPARTKDYARDTALIVVVARDNRGGVGWRSGVVALAPQATP
jgi:hypothetical protein